METIHLGPGVRYPSKVLLWLSFVMILILAFCLLMGIGIGASEAGARGAWTGGLIALGANLLWYIPGLLLIGPYYRSLHYAIEDDEVIVRVGVITRSVKHVPYRTVTNLEVKRDPFDRLLGIGTLRIQTAGMSGQTGAEESLVGLDNVDEIYQTVAARLRQFRAALPPTQAGEEGTRTAAPLAGDGALLDAMLSELKAIRRALEKD